MIWSHDFRLLAVACMATAIVQQQKVVMPMAFLSTSEPQRTSMRQAESRI